MATILLLNEGVDEELEQQLDNCVIQRNVFTNDDTSVHLMTCDKKDEWRLSVFTDWY